MDDRFTSQQQMLEHALEQQVVLARIALELNSLEKFDCRLNNCLEQVGEHTDVSRVYIFENNEDGTIVSNTFEWCNKGIAPEIKNLQDMPYEAIPTWINSLKNEGRIYSENISEMAQEVRDILEPQGVISIIVYPLYIKEGFFGFMGFDECNKVRKWSKSELEMLRAVSGIISHAYERRAMEQELIKERDRANRANQAKSEFLANMGHEIRTPMNAILGFSEALYHRLSAPENRQMLSSVMSAGHQLLALLNDLLDLSRIEAGRMELVTGPANLSSILYDIHSIYRDKAAKKGLSLLVEIPKDLPATLVLDETRIRQVLGSLVDNAIKFTQKGEVKLWGSFERNKPDAGKLVIWVEDTGIGIEKDMWDAIFEDFLQLNPQPNRKYEGTGLGLAISKRLVEKMNGTLDVESSPGKGSVFTVVIPGVLFDAASHDAASQESGATSPKGGAASHEAVAQDADPPIRQDNKEKLPALVHLLRNEYMKEWTGLRNQLVIFRIEQFARDLEALAGEYESGTLLTYATELFRQADTFDLEGLREGMDAFPALIIELERTAEDYVVSLP